MHVIKGFEHRPTHHCVTGSMLDVYGFHGCVVSEDMLLGLGEGVGAGYFRFKGMAPFFGGRGEPEGGSVALACERTGVAVRARKSGSHAAAEKSLLKSLAAGEPMMLQVDMRFLPYFDFGGEEYHFGDHAVGAVGFDEAEGTVTIADRDEELHGVPLAALRQARASKFRLTPLVRARGDAEPVVVGVRLWRGSLHVERCPAGVRAGLRWRDAFTPLLSLAAPLGAATVREARRCGSSGTRRGGEDVTLAPLAPSRGCLLLLALVLGRFGEDLGELAEAVGVAVVHFEPRGVRVQDHVGVVLAVLLVDLLEDGDAAADE